MASLDDPGVRSLLEGVNHAVVSTLGADGSIHSAVVWIDLVDGVLAVNSAVGRRWPSNLGRDPRVTLIVWEEGNPYHYVEIRGVASGTTDGADDHIDRLAHKYTGSERFAGGEPGEERIKFTISPARIRHAGY